MNINNHRLEGENVNMVGSPNRGDRLAPDTIVLHYTAGPSAASAIRTLCNPDRKASAHLVVDARGEVTQLVPFSIVAWHVGKSRHENRIGLNQYSIGIEIVNAGRLRKSGAAYVSWFGKKYPPEEVFYGVHRNEQLATYWHEFTEEQIQMVQELCELLASSYSIKYILGHEEISPGRKIDPGPAFPLDKMRNRILDLQPRDANEIDLEGGKDAITSVNKLNIRSGPSTSYSIIAPPLSKGQKVQILAESNGWRRVRTTIEGWVVGQYLRDV